MSLVPQYTINELDYEAAKRWHHRELFDAGFVAVPTFFLQLYARLNPPLTSGEALFVIQLMNFKWTKRAPFPSYKVLAKRMGLSDKAVRRHAAALESKGYLKRIERIGATNQFDLMPLFDAFLKVVQQLKKEAQANGGSKL